MLSNLMNISRIKKKITNLILKENALPLFINQKKLFKNSIKFNICTFGNKNRDKVFYVIRRSPGAGLFSNVIYVLNHLQIAEQNNFIPIVDMENFTTIYNEKEKIDNTYNAWEYYFEKINKYSLKDVYKSQNVILGNSFYQFIDKKNSFNISIDLDNKKYSEYIKKIKIKKKFLIEAQKFFLDNFNYNDKILGVHFRGSTYKNAAGHAFPSTISEMIKNINNLLDKYKYNKIFLVTEEDKYLNALKKEFGDKLIFYKSYRMKTIDSFKLYPRKLHRFKLGKETLIEAIILSKCHGISYVKSHIASFAKLLSKKKQADHEIFFGYNSKNKYVSSCMWYLKFYFPFVFGRIKLKKKLK